MVLSVVFMWKRLRVRGIDAREMDLHILWYGKTKKKIELNTKIRVWIERKLYVDGEVDL